MKALPSPRQLQYLVALAEHAHVGRAAIACGVSQSTLSAGLMAFERLLGAGLLARSPARHVALTPLGRQVLVAARTALAALEAVADQATARQPMSGSPRIGVIPTVGPFLLPALMPVLRARFPLLNPWLREDTTPRLLAALAEGRVDLLLLALPCDCAGAELLPLFDDPFLVALPLGHRLSAQERIATADLAAEAVLLLEDGHCLRDQAIAACGLIPAQHAEGFSATSLHTLVQMVAGGLGVTLLPRLAIAAGVTDGAAVSLRPLASEDRFMPGRRIGLAWRRGATHAAEYRALGKAVIDAGAALFDAARIDDIRARAGPGHDGEGVT